MRGLTTVTFFADDLDRRPAWYAELLGIEPYFERPGRGPPAYIEFRIGDYQHELGIIDQRFAPARPRDGRPAGAIIYWHVDDVEAALRRGCWPSAPRRTSRADRAGPGFVTASVVDPFGNILGVMYNQHYLAMSA